MPRFVKIDKSGKGGRVSIHRKFLDHMNTGPGDYVALHMFEGGLIVIQPHPNNAPLPVVTLRGLDINSNRPQTAHIHA